MAPKEKADEIFIGQSVEIGGQIFVPGDEEELKAVISAEQVKHLTKQGTIRGFKGAPSQASRDKARSAADEKSGSPAGSSAEARKPTTEPLASKIPPNASRTGDETAGLMGGTKAGVPAKGVEPASGARKSTSKSSGAAKDDEFDPDRATMAELEEKLGEANLPAKGTGSNGQLTKKDLVKAYKKLNA